MVAARGGDLGSVRLALYERAATKAPALESEEHCLLNSVK